MRKGSNPDQICLKCGKKFHVKLSRVLKGKGKYCSRECYLQRSPHFDKEWLRQKYCNEHLTTAEIAKIVQVDTVTIRSQVCKFGLKRKKKITEEHKQKLRIAREGKKHSEETKRKMSKAQLGEKGHNWKGGVIPLKFRSPWKQNKVKALKRDDFKCQICGKIKSDNGERELDVHHKVPFRCFDNPTDAHDIENLITLCRVCHFQEDARKKIVDTVVGAGTKIWNYVNLYKAKIGNNVSIGSFVEIGKDVIIGDNTRIGALSFIPEGFTVGKNVFIGPNFCGINDRYPPSSRDKWEKTIIEDGARIGASVTVMCGVTIGKGALVGAGSVVIDDVASNIVVIGVRAKTKEDMINFKAERNSFIHKAQHTLLAIFDGLDEVDRRLKSMEH